MNFRPLDKKVEEILGGKNCYQIPIFQRDYSWGQKNYEDFINDLFESCSASIEQNKIQLDEKSQYFFGTILVVGESSQPTIDRPYVVIDGQQRLTTMALFYAAILENISKIDETYITDFKDRLILYEPVMGEQQEHSRLVNKKLEPILSINVLDLNNRKSDGSRHDPTNNVQRWVLESYDIIKKMLEKDQIVKRISKDKTYSNEISNRSYVSFLDAFGKYISKSILIIIYVEDIQAANLIYRNLNYRGKPLTQPDLIKNEIFSILNDPSGSISKSWDEIEKNIFESDESLSAFFYYHMRAIYNGVSKRNLFSIFLKNKPKETEKIRKKYQNFVNNLAESSQFYKILVKPNEIVDIFNTKNYFHRNDNMSIRRGLLLLNSMEIAQVRTLLLAGFKARNKNLINDKQLIKIVNTIALNQVLHVLAKTRANQLTSIYRNCANSILNLEKCTNPKKSEDIISELKDSLKKRIPNRELVLTADLNYNHKNNDNSKSDFKKQRTLIGHILSIVSIYAQSKETQAGNDGLSFIYDASLEHIIDQRNNEKILENIGNIILLEKDKHKDVKSMEEKRTMYERSSITLTKTFWKNRETFTKEDIQKRKNELLNSYYDIVNDL